MTLFKGNLLQQRIGLASSCASWKEATVAAYKSFSIDVHITQPQLQAAKEKGESTLTVEWVWMVQSNDIAFDASFQPDKPKANSPKASEQGNAVAEGSIFGAAAAMLGGRVSQDGEGESGWRTERHKAQDGPRSSSFAVSSPGILTLKWDNR
jgi:hypothetical protein